MIIMVIVRIVVIVRVLFLKILNFVCLDIWEVMWILVLKILVGDVDLLLELI